MDVLVVLFFDVYSIGWPTNHLSPSHLFRNVGDGDGRCVGIVLDTNLFWCVFVRGLFSACYDHQI